MDAVEVFPFCLPAQSPALVSEFSRLLESNTDRIHASLRNMILPYGADTIRRGTLVALQIGIDLSRRKLMRLGLCPTNWPDDPDQWYSIGHRFD